MAVDVKFTDESDLRDNTEAKDSEEFVVGVESLEKVFVSGNGFKTSGDETERWSGGVVFKFTATNALAFFKR